MKAKHAAVPLRKAIAVFDYDNTLVKGDSLWPFLVAVAGWRRACLALAIALIRLMFAWRKGLDVRTFVKDQLLRQLLAGRRVEDLLRPSRKCGAGRGNAVSS